MSQSVKRKFKEITEEEIHIKTDITADEDNETITNDKEFEEPKKSNFPSTKTTHVGRKCNWTLQMTRTFIAEYDKRRNSPEHLGKRKDLFHAISQSLTKKGYPFTMDDCDRKWRNLTQTFRSIYFKVSKDNQQGDKETVRWPFYYELFDILKDEGKLETVERGYKDIVEGENNEENNEEEVPTHENVNNLEDYNSSDEENAENSETAVVMLNKLRNSQLEIENKRLDELKKLRVAIEESNEIQKKRNELIKLFIEKLN